MFIRYSPLVYRKLVTPLGITTILKLKRIKMKWFSLKSQDLPTVVTTEYRVSFCSYSYRRSKLW